MVELLKKNNQRGNYSAVEIAQLLLSYDPKRKYFKEGKMILQTDETNPTIGNFWENLWAYPRGGIVYIVYKNFFELFKEELEPQEIPIKEEDRKFVSKVYHYFKKCPDKELENFLHDDISWKETWELKKEVDDDQMIVTEKVKNFYHDLLGHIVKEVGLNQ